jgi:hypothetical protein
MSIPSLILFPRSQVAWDQARHLASNALLRMLCQELQEDVLAM